MSPMLISAFFSAQLLGCNPVPPPTSKLDTQTPNPGTTASIPSDNPSSNANTTSPTPDGTVTQDPPGSQTRKHRENPRRLFQLDDLEQVKIKIGKHEFSSWVMDTEDKRAEGMMFLENQDFTEKDSMIFVYNEPFEMSFWMRNTLVDLDIAYVGKDKKIVRVTTMKRLDETGVPSNGSSQYAIEFKGGLLKKLGITKGMSVEMPPLKSKD